MFWFIFVFLWDFVLKQKSIGHSMISVFSALYCACKGRKMRNSRFVYYRSSKPGVLLQSMWAGKIAENFINLTALRCKTYDNVHRTNEISLKRLWFFFSGEQRGIWSKVWLGIHCWWSCCHGRVSIAGLIQHSNFHICVRSNCLKYYIVARL